jgi:mannose-6-phosphate isomerase-like protein (cupin superfamily)
MQPSPATGNCDSGPHSLEDLVRHVDALDWHEQGDTRWATAFDSTQGTRKLSLYLAEVTNGIAGPIEFASSEAVIYVLSGDGAISIGDRDFETQSGDGAYVRPGERFVLKQSGSEALRIVMAVCPSTKTPPWESKGLQPGPEAFDDGFPIRIASSKNAPSEATGDRSFKVLVGPRIGSTAVTQFIGSIPRSKAPEHYHHYEEVICVLSGEGKAWIGNKCSAIGPGSLIFLPRKQPHCLECNTAQGMELVGMFYPAGSPAVNYETDAA